MLSNFLQVLGAPKGRPPEFYRDVTLAIVGTPTSLIAVTLGVVHAFDPLFWTSTAVFVLCIVFATNRRAILAVPLLYAGTRFVLGSALFGGASMFAVGALCLVAVWMLAKLR